MQNKAAESMFLFMKKMQMKYTESCKAESLYTHEAQMKYIFTPTQFFHFFYFNQVYTQKVYPHIESFKENHLFPSTSSDHDGNSEEELRLSESSTY